MARLSQKTQAELIENLGEPAALTAAEMQRASLLPEETAFANEEVRDELAFTMSIAFPAPELPATNEAAQSSIVWLDPWYSRLPKVTAQDVEGSMALATIPIPFLQQVTATLKTALARYCRTSEAEVAIHSSHAQEARLPWQPPASETLLFVTLSLLPERAPLTLMLDTSLALALIDYSLGGNGMCEARRPLSVTESAILEFILLQMLQELQLHLAAPILVLERVTATPPPWLQTESSSFAPQRFLHVPARLRVSKALGLVEVKASQEALRLLQKYAPHFTTATVEQTFATEKLQRYARFLPELSAALIVGQTKISVHELAELSSGDIVLLEQTNITWQEKRLAGEFCVRAGNTEQIFFLGQALRTAADATLQMQVAAFRLPPTVSQGVFMSDANFGNYFAEPSQAQPETPASPAQDAYDPSAEAAAFEQVVQESISGLGRTIDGLLVTLQVELAARRLPLQEVAQMREGQIIDLGCHATDLVNILVEGRIIARGDLVEFDGQLGVRITEIAA